MMPHQIGSIHGLILLAGLLAVLPGCATYHAQPLPRHPQWSRAGRLTVPTQKLRIPGLRSHRFNAANGLDMFETVTLAVVNNPNLKAKRTQAGVAAAQLLQAGLLPNPQLSTTFLDPVGGPAPAYKAYTMSLTQDLTALVSRGAKRAAARAHAKQVNLNIYWQEWQVAQRARQLYIQARAQARLHKVLVAQHKLYAAQYRREHRALRRGNLTLSTTSAALVLLVNASTQLRTLERQRNTTWHKLDELLGLPPGTRPELAGKIHFAGLSKQEFAAAIARLPQRRPDLIALQAGYKSQEQSVRKAILQQFPKLSVGPAGERDNGLISSVGFSINLSLPLFDRNQGQIAIARATRTMLRQTYQARLDQAVNQAHQMFREVRIMARQHQQLAARLPALEQTTDAAQRAFNHGDLSAGTFINLRSSLLSKQVESIRLESSLQQARAALDTLLGMLLEPSGANQSGGAGPEAHS